MAELKFEIRMSDPAGNFKPLNFTETLGIERADVEGYALGDAKRREHTLQSGESVEVAEKLARIPRRLQDKVEAAFIAHRVMVTFYAMKLLFEMPEFADLKTEIPGMDHIDVGPFLK